MDKAVRIRQRVLAVSLPITALFYASAEALNPKGTDVVLSDTASAIKVLPIAAAHSAQLYLSGSLTLLALGSLAASYPAIATLVRDRGWVLATVAALIGAAGAVCGIVANVHGDVDLAAAAAAHLSPGAAARYLVTASTSASNLAFLYVYFISNYVAPTVMAIALWRSRSVPRWLAVLFFAATMVAEMLPSFGPIVLVYMLPFAITMVLLALRIWEAAAEVPARTGAPTTGQTLKRNSTTSPSRMM